MFSQISYDLGEVRERSLLTSTAAEEEHLTRDRVPLPCSKPCVNPATNDTYHLRDECTPEIFKENCPDCEKVKLYEYFKLGFMQ